MVSSKIWCLALLASPALAALPDLTAKLQELVETNSVKNNCSISLAVFDGEDSLQAVAGIADFESGTRAQATDCYAWGSGTKPLTGASILKLVSEKKFGLDDKAAPLVDPFLKKLAASDASQDFESMAGLWGAENVTNITIRQLLTMQTGIPDFDTATAHGHSGGAEDPLRASLYATPGRSYSPTELMNFSWVRGQYRTRTGYSSTNFMLLGMILAADAGVETWSDFDQGGFLPDDLKLRFALTGAPRDFGCAHGTDRTMYNVPDNTSNDIDVGGVNGVFAGWTASDLVASALEVAKMAWDIYGPKPTVAPLEYTVLMHNNGSSPSQTRRRRSTTTSASPVAVTQGLGETYGSYGLATFNFNRITGHSLSEGLYGIAYGHKGITYGYTSNVVMFPAINVSIAVATNVEDGNQLKVDETMCFAYNMVTSALLGQDIACNYTQYGRKGGCECDVIEGEPGAMIA